MAIGNSDPHFAAYLAVLPLIVSTLMMLMPRLGGIRCL
jgi:hypothetical protein